MTDQETYERVRDLIKSNLRNFSCSCVECSYNMANEILAIKGIRIESDDQSLPKIYNEKVYTESNKMTERAMLKANFVKVLPKQAKREGREE